MAIIGSTSNEVSILGKLEASHFYFNLTGSRVGLNTVQPMSDWDFFVQDSEDVRHWLTSNGFKLHGESYEDDPQIARVYRYETDVTHIDVQCVTDFDKKLRIQTAFLKSDALRGLTKPQARKLWRFAYELLK